MLTNVVVADVVDSITSFSLTFAPPVVIEKVKNKKAISLYSHGEIV